MNNQPLAERLRPQKIEQLIGQSNLLGPGGPLRRMLEENQLVSMVFYGPAGTGKTTMARLIARHSNRAFRQLSAVESGIKEVKSVIAEARMGGIVLFIDELHRFNKAQQDVLLGPVESGAIILIGATTENPGFEINRALLSRCTVFAFQPFTDSELLKFLEQGIETLNEETKRQVSIDATEFFIQYSKGDARKLLNSLELVYRALPSDVEVLTAEFGAKNLQENPLAYDKKGDNHYDMASALIKSMRGSDPDAAIYYMTRMLVAGEDPKFIARRLIIFASEDIGMANPAGLMVAVDAAKGVEFVGLPEAEIILAHATCFLATSEKSNSSYMALKQAKKVIQKTGNLPVPLHLRNAANSFLKDQGAGKGYQYPHDYPNNYVAGEQYLPTQIVNETLYKPANNAREQQWVSRKKGMDKK